MSTLPELTLVAALTHERVIGRGREIPWHYSEDMKHFRTVTKGHALIMGRTTFESIGKPLPGRRNIVVSREPGLAIEGAEVASSVGAAIALARTTDPAPCVIGGAQIYEAALPLATRLELTYVHEPHAGDVLFPRFDASEFREVARREGEGLTFVTLERVDAGASP